MVLRRLDLSPFLKWSRKLRKNQKTSNSFNRVGVPNRNLKEIPGFRGGLGRERIAVGIRDYDELETTTRDPLTGRESSSG